MRSGEHSSIPSQMTETYEAVVALTDRFCTQQLNSEYAALCRNLAAVLARKRPSPLARGKSETWACGIVHALGLVNFLFDPGERPHVRASALYSAFGVSANSGSAKSKSIRDTLRFRSFDPRWTLPSRVADNPMAWIIEVNGLMVDVRDLPRHVQVLAHKQGLIPYVFADGPEDHLTSADEPGSPAGRS